MDLIERILEFARGNNCSDIHLSYGLPPIFRINGDVVRSDFELSNEEIFKMINSLLDDNQKKLLQEKIDVDFAFEKRGLRYRVNVYYQQGSIAAAIRLLNDTIPTLEKLDLPPAIEKLASMPNGLVLVTGPTGSGKSTTLAAMIDYINSTRKGHILTLEDPVEYLHKNKKSILHQREVGTDVIDFKSALKSALREDPDVILVGEMRDLETISAAITAAETGHLVLSTLHTTGAANTIDRIIDSYPEGDKNQVRAQLATTLRGVVTQQLIPNLTRTKRVPAFEILIMNAAISNLIRENKCFQINSILQTGTKEGMVALNNDLARLVKCGEISVEDAIEKTNNPQILARLVDISI